MENSAMDASERLTSKSNILAIGDHFPKNTNKKREITKCEFKSEFPKRLSQLVMGDTYVIAEKKFAMEDLLMHIIKVDDLTKHYVFSINKTDDACISYGRTIDAKSVLRATKKKLSNEKWISENVMEKTCQKKDATHFKVDNTVYQAMSDSLNEQAHQIINYVCFLQQEFLKQRKP
ncbi:uncharacterized protein LOC127565643 isoform X2 [Drosophila albomicans]|uniref:Uncharacterized protein LOC127565643 isoform X2 n=1 Tax=Drosophila albomicans TaxID=7291 RepID=A0A9C6SY60_DROAB|nr:uncharacterized protein LOC127565643 isoform X2 [Drosophila albomicans]